jgi:two-component sensor histidine kinase
MKVDPTKSKQNTSQELTRLRQSEFRYRMIFDRSSVSMWEEDYSRVFQTLHRLREGGVADLRAYLRSHPEMVDVLLGQITVLDINEVTLRMYNADSKDHFLGSLDKVFLEEAKVDFIEQIATIFDGANYFEGETSGKKITGEKMTLLIRITVPELLGKADYSNVLVSLIDITERKRREEDNIRLLQFSESLRASTLALASTMDHDRILDTILEESRKIIDFTGVVIGLVENDRIRIARYKASAGFNMRIQDFQDIHTHPETYSFVLSLKNTGKPLLIKNTKKNPGRSPFPAAEWVASYLGIPLIVRDRFIGFINFYDSEPNAFSEEILHFLEPFATFAAVALENARLFREAEKEIQERRRAEEQLRKSLEEKKVLLMEVHHRVKNNLNIVASLLNLQSSHIKTVEQARRALQNSQNRVHSMAMVHEQLYRSDKLANIEIGTYARDLTTELIQLYETQTPVVPEIKTDHLLLSINRAIPFGLLLNEVITNALIHAFSGRKDPGHLTVEITKKSSREALLRVTDDGLGIPEDILAGNTRSLGFQLIEVLSQQLQGTSRFTSTQGKTRFELSFPLDEY